MTEPQIAQSASTRRLWLVYTGLRLAVFAGVAAALYLLTRMNGFPLLLVSLLVSSILSLFFLPSQREALVAAQQLRAEQREQEKAALRQRLDDTD